jgi:ABC-2 type transport system ATP-binding protein
MLSARMSAQTAIEVRDLSKSFRIPLHRKDTLKERALKPLSRTQHRELHALRDVSFEVGAGEFFGVVGRNGSGKSTLLKLLASIYRADAGEIRVAGTIAPFIELAVGFNLEFTAYENSLLNGVMMGLSRKEAERRFDAVIEFAELEEFGDLKLKNYSSGMLTRLAFSLMVQVDADVMLIDEVLAVGDASFQRKCAEVFERLRGKRTIVFVTHDMSAVERFCHRAMLIDHGRIAETGEPEEVAGSYTRLNFVQDAGEAPAVTAGEPASADAAERPARFDGLWVETEAGERRYNFRTQERIRFGATITASEAVEDPRFGFGVQNTDGDWILTVPYGRIAERIEPGARIEVQATLENPLAGGQYFLGCALISGDREHAPVAVATEVGFVVNGPGPPGGVLALAYDASSRSIELGSATR